MELMEVGQHAAASSTLRILMVGQRVSVQVAQVGVYAPGRVHHCRGSGTPIDFIIYPTSEVRGRRDHEAPTSSE